MTQTAPVPAAPAQRPATPPVAAEGDARRRGPQREAQPFAMFEATLERAAPAPARAPALPLADAADSPATGAEPPPVADAASPGLAPAALAAPSAARDPAASLAAALALAAPPPASPSPPQGRPAPRPAPAAGPAPDTPTPVPLSLSLSPRPAAPPQTAVSFEARQGGERAAPSRADVDVAALAAAPDLDSAVETHLLPARWPQTVERIVAAADEARAATGGAPAAPDSPPRPAVGLLRLTLEPERLGAVTVTLRLRGDALEARLATERPETAALLEGRRAELSDALRRAGYEIEQLSFTPAPPAVEPARRGEAAREAAQERREPGEQRRDDGAQDDGGRRDDRGSQEDRDARRRWRGLRRDDLDAG